MLSMSTVCVRACVCMRVWLWAHANLCVCKYVYTYVQYVCITAHLYAACMNTCTHKTCKYVGKILLQACLTSLTFINVTTKYGPRFEKIIWQLHFY